MSALVSKVNAKNLFQNIKINSEPNLGASLTSLCEILETWKVINSKKELMIDEDIELEPLEGLSLARWKCLLNSPIHISWDNFSIKMTHETFAKEFNQFLAQSFEYKKEAKMYLRGSYALYILDIRKYFEKIIDLHLKKKPTSEANHKKQFIRKFLDQLEKNWINMEAPKDVDWINIIDCRFDEALHYLIFFLISKAKGQGQRKPEFSEVYNNAFRKLTITKKNFFNLEEDQYVIASLKTISPSVDIVITDLEYKTMASCCDVLIHFEDSKSYTAFPECTKGFFAQIVADRVMQVLRIQDRHAKNFPALVTFCQYLYQGFTLYPDERSLQRAFLPILSKVVDDSEAYKKMLQIIEARVTNHSIEPISYLFSVMMQMGEALPKKDFITSLWSDILKKIVQYGSDKKLVELCLYFRNDFFGLVDVLAELSMVAASQSNKNYSLTQIQKDAVILHFQEFYFYIPKRYLKKMNETCSHLPLELENVLHSLIPITDLKFNSFANESNKLLLKEYLEHQLLPNCNPYQLFLKLSLISPASLLPQTIKDGLVPLFKQKELSVFSKQIFDWLSIWYPSLQRAQNKNPLQHLPLIAKNNPDDAFEIWNKIGDGDSVVLFHIVEAIAIPYPDKTLFYLRKNPHLKPEQLLIVYRSLLQNPTSERIVEMGHSLLQWVNISLDSFLPFFIKLCHKYELNDLSQNVYIVAVQKKLIHSDIGEKLFREFLKVTSADQLYSIYLSIEKDLILNEEIIAEVQLLFSTLKILTKTPEVHLQQYIEKLLYQKKYKEAFEHYLKGEKILNNRENVLTPIIELAFDNKDYFYVIKIATLVNDNNFNPYFEKYYSEIIYQILEKNIGISFEFLFSPLALKILPKCLIKEIIIKLGKSFPSFYHEKEILGIFAKCLVNKIENYSYEIQLILGLFANHLSHHQTLQKELCKTLCESLGILTQFFSNNEEVLISLLKLSNFYKITWEDSVEETFLNAIEDSNDLDLFCVCLQQHRFRNINTHFISQLLKILNRNKTGIGEEHNKVLFQEFKHVLNFCSLTSKEKDRLSTNITDNNFLQLLIETYVQYDPLFVETLLDRYFDSLTKLPIEKLFPLFKGCAEILNNKEVINKYLIYFLHELDLNFSAFGYLLIRYQFNDLKNLKLYFEKIFSSEKTSHKQIPLKLLIDLDLYLDKDSQLYGVVWNKTIHNSLTLDFDTKLYLDLLKNKDLLVHLDAQIKILLLNAAISHIKNNECLNDILQEIISYEPDDLYYSVVEAFLIKLSKLNHNELYEKLLNHLIHLLKTHDHLLCLEQILNLLVFYTKNNLSVDFFEFLYAKVLSSNFDINYFIIAMAMQKENFEILKKAFEITCQILKEKKTIKLESSYLLFNHLAEFPDYRVNLMAIDLLCGLGENEIVKTEVCRHDLIKLSALLFKNLAKCKIFDKDAFFLVLKTWTIAKPKLKDLEDNAKEAWQNISLCLMSLLKRSDPHVYLKNLCLIFDEYKKFYEGTQDLAVFFKEHLESYKAIKLNQSQCKIVLPHLTNFALKHFNPLEENGLAALDILFYLCLACTEPISDGGSSNAFSLMQARKVASCIYKSGNEHKKQEFAVVLQVNSRVESLDVELSFKQTREALQKIFLAFPNSNNFIRAYNFINAFDIKFIVGISFLERFKNSLVYIDALEGVIPFKILHYFLDLFNKHVTFEKLETKQKETLILHHDFLTLLNKTFEKNNSEIEYITLFLNAEIIGYRKKLRTYRKFLERINNFFEKFKKEVFVQKDESHLMCFDLFLDAINESPIHLFEESDTKLKKEITIKFFAHFFENILTQNKANEHLENYLFTCKSLNYDKISDYLKNVQVCFEANKSDNQNISVISKAILFRPRLKLNESEFDIKHKQSETLAVWLSNFKGNTNDIIREAIQLGLFRGGLLKYFGKT